MVTTTRMIAVPRTRAVIGLLRDEADRLATELAQMEEALHEPGLKAFDVFDVDAARATRREWLDAAMPAHEVEVGPFEIAIYPVTFAEYAQFCDQTGAPAPERIAGVDPRAFVTGISWQEALAYARHQGLDLPTENEWEIAARADRRFFTWGDSYFPQGEVAFQPPVDQPYAVGSRPATKSSRGVNDLLGPFGEFCKDELAPYPESSPAWWDAHFPAWRGQRVVRGGYDIHQDATCVSRRGVPPAERRTHVKFRCVRRT